MSTSHKLSMLAGTTLVALLQVAAVAPAVAQNMDMKEVQAQIQALQKQIQDLQAQVNNAQATADSLIYLPTYPRYGENEIKNTIAAIRGRDG